MATVEFACDRCGTFLNSVDGAVAICRCDGAFHAPVAPPSDAKPLFPNVPALEPEETAPEKPPETQFYPEQSGAPPDAATSATFGPLPEMTEHGEADTELAVIDFSDPDCKQCTFKTRAKDVEAAMLRHYAGHDSNAE